MDRWEGLEEVYANNKVRKRSHSPIPEKKKNPHDTPRGDQRDIFVNVWSFSGRNESNAWNGLNVKAMENELGLVGFPQCLGEGKPAPTWLSDVAVG